jgi:hypothetical protein
MDSLSGHRLLLCAACGLVLMAATAQAWFPVSKAEFEQTLPTAAFDGSNYLVAWTDARDLRTDTSVNIYACRITRDGDVLDSAGILVAAAPACSASRTSRPTARHTLSYGPTSSRTSSTSAGCWSIRAERWERNSTLGRRLGPI